MIKKNAKIKVQFLYWLIAFSFLARLVAAYFTGDINDLQSASVNEWNILIRNFIKYKTYSFYTHLGEAIPSVYMPPFYPFLLYLIKSSTSFLGLNFLYTTILIQIILSTYSIYLFYKISENFFSQKVSLINSIIFSLIPINLYASGQISSINIQILLSLLFLKFLLSILKREKEKDIIYISIISGLLILTRGEFVLIFLAIVFYIFFQKKIQLNNLIKIAIITFLIISPYVVRNYIHFKEIIIVKSLGYNLWKGNNQFANVEGYSNLNRIEFKDLKNKIDKIEKNKYYEINRDNTFLKESLDNLKKETPEYVGLFFKKLMSYYFININSNYPNYYNFFHFLPILLISVLSFFGLFVFYEKNKVENKCLGIYLFSNLIIFSIFFILPRYKLIILPIQIILATHFIIYIMKKYVSK